MLNALLPAALLILAPLWEQLRRGRPFMLFAVIAAVYLTLAGLTAVIFRTPALLDRLAAPVVTDGTYHDTYYVVSHSSFSLWLALVFAVIALITWAQTEAGAMYYRRLTCTAFWGLHLSILASAAAPLFLATSMPRRYVEYEDAFETITHATSLFSFAAFMFLCALGVLLLLSILRRLSQRSHD